MGSIWPVTIVMISYWTFVLKIGPEFMKSRKPLQINFYIKVYNVVQILFSMYLLVEVNKNLQYFTEIKV